MDINTFLGVAYYPEAWDISQVETDLDKMRDYGIGCVRMRPHSRICLEDHGTRGGKIRFLAVPQGGGRM